MRGATLLALDFDGTLAPIRDDPSDARIDRAALALLLEATRARGVIVAIISGRDVDDLASRVDVPGAYMVGSHGLEIRAPGGVLVRDVPSLKPDLGPDLVETLQSADLRIERKKHAIAVHWRGLDYDRVAPAVRQFRQWARDAGLELIDGRCVVEGRLQGGGKEEALRWLEQALGASRIIYAGDDATDFGALGYAARSGLALFVASDEREAPSNVKVVDSFRELFRVIRQEVMI